MNFKTSIKILATLLVAMSGSVRAEPLRIIIVSESDGKSEQRYRQFLQEIYRGNAVVSVDADRYDEDLSDKKKIELASADLIVVSRDTEGTQYNADAEFWNGVHVPILNHNAKLARSDGHRFWDWLDGDTTECNSCTELSIANPADPVFTGIDVSTGAVRMFTRAVEVDHSDQASAGNGTAVGAINGNIAIAIWSGAEARYYDGSLYGPGAPRLLFAMPDDPGDFFDDATDEALLMLENAIISLLPASLPEGDLDGDADVDFEDVAVFGDCWTQGRFPLSGHCAYADLSGDQKLSGDDLAIIAATWLDGVDVTAPEPNTMTWKHEPETVSTASIRMAADFALDSQNGVRYYFQCTGGNGPDSEWQYRNMFEPGTLTPGKLYTYRVKARDTSANLNETQWSIPASARPFGLYRYIADASAAVALNENLFIVGGDEVSSLRVYERNNPASIPILNIGIATYLNIEPEHPECDIEGATWLGERIFWITSHGRNRDGNYQYSRHQFFATTVTLDGAAVARFSVDGNYTNLINDLIAYDATYNLGLVDAIGVADGCIDANTIPNLAPKEDGLNIEGLCATPEGDSMLIAFRNPRPEIDDDKHALIIRLRNPEQVVLSGEMPLFDPPILLDLGPFGIRSIEYSPALGAYLIVAGSHQSSDDEPLQILYSYDIVTGDLDKLHEFPDITPEAMFQFPNSSDIQLLSDDGVLLVDTPVGPRENKYLPVQYRTFRTHTISP